MAFRANLLCEAEQHLQAVLHTRCTQCASTLEEVMELTEADRDKVRTSKESPFLIWSIFRFCQTTLATRWSSSSATCLPQTSPGPVSCPHSDFIIILYVNTLINKLILKHFNYELNEYTRVSLTSTIPIWTWWLIYIRSLAFQYSCQVSKIDSQTVACLS